MADSSISEPQKKRGGPGRPFQPGQSGNPGGRPKKLVEIERMLDEEHRTVENIREVFAQLRAMATENVVSITEDKDGNKKESVRQPNPAFMQMYLERVMGPVKELELDLSNASDETIRWLAENGVKGN